MNMIRKIPVRLRIVVCMLAVALGMLALGAVRIQDGLRNESELRDESRLRCRTALEAWSDAFSEQGRAEWLVLAEQSPELCLRAACGPLTSLRTPPHD